VSNVRSVASFKDFRFGAERSQARQIILREVVGDFEPWRVQLDEDVLVGLHLRIVVEKPGGNFEQS